MLLLAIDQVKPAVEFLNTRLNICRSAGAIPKVAIDIVDKFEGIGTVKPKPDAQGAQPVASLVLVGPQRLLRVLPFYKRCLRYTRLLFRACSELLPIHNQLLNVVSQCFCIYIENVRQFLGRDTNGFLFAKALPDKACTVIQAEQQKGRSVLQRTAIAEREVLPIRKFDNVVIGHLILLWRALVLMLNNRLRSRYFADAGGKPWVGARCRFHWRCVVMRSPFA